MSTVTVLDSAETLVNSWGILPVHFDNSDFQSDNQSEWCRVVVADGDSFKEGFGCNRTRRTGLVIVSVFVPINTGSRQARVYSEQISELFNNLTTGEGIVYRTPSLNRVGPANGFYQFNINIPFEHSEDLSS